MRALLIVCFFLVSPLAVQAQPAPLAERLRAQFQTAQTSRDISGAIAMRRGDVLLAYERFGEADYETGTALTPQTRFSAGSMSQALVLALLLELEEDGRLDRDAPVRSLIPELLTGYTATIGEVMAGTSALPAIQRDALIDARTDTYVSWFNHSYEPATAVTAAESGAWLPLLVILAERAGGGRLELLSTLHVFAPLGMTDSVFHRGSGQAPLRRAIGYEPAGSPLQIDRAADMPAGLIDHGWWTTPDDLLRFAAALSRREIDFFTTDGRFAGGLARVMVANEAVYVLEGEADGFRTGLLFIPSQDITVSYALNLVSYPVEGLAEALAHIALSQPLESLPERLASYQWLNSHLDAAGEYALPSGERLELRVSPGGLVLQPSGELLTPTGEDRLLWRRMNTELLMMRRADGAVERLAATRHLPLQTPEQFEIVRTDLPAPVIETAD
ncbi:MAG: beta-lactamase family protein [Alphaproteobacteria bacterium]|nr:beta-lactamase family protein [Alphaproteobacteria bacterium]